MSVNLHAVFYARQPPFRSCSDGGRQHRECRFDLGTGRRPGLPAHRAIKAMSSTATRALALITRRAGIRANVVYHRLIDTPMTGFVDRLAPGPEWTDRSPLRRRRRRRDRRVVAFVASDRNQLHDRRQRPGRRRRVVAASQPSLPELIATTARVNSAGFPAGLHRTPIGSARCSACIALYRVQRSKPRSVIPGARSRADSQRVHHACWLPTARIWTGSGTAIMGNTCALGSGAVSRARTGLALPACSPPEMTEDREASGHHRKAAGRQDTLTRITMTELKVPLQPSQASRVRSKWAPASDVRSCWRTSVARVCRAGERRGAAAGRCASDGYPVCAGADDARAAAHRPRLCRLQVGAGRGGHLIRALTAHGVEDYAFFAQQPASESLACKLVLDDHVAGCGW